MNKECPPETAKQSIQDSDPAELTADQWRRIFDAVPDMIALIDNNHRVTMVNKAMADRLGCPPREATNRFCYEIVHDLAAPPDFCPHSKTISDHQTASVEVGEERLDGIFQVTTTPYFDSRGQLQGSIHIARDITGQKQKEEALRESEARVRKKLQTIMEPDGGIEILNLEDIIEQQTLQSMMDDFYRLTNIGIGVVSLSGKVLVSTGWQDICTKFHRIHPETHQNCIESDTLLATGIPPGKIKSYQCKNHMWDLATPIEIGGRHMGNVFLGQFFYDDEVPDREMFRDQARRYGFDETEYLAAVDKVPRWNRATVHNAMMFYAKLAAIISSMTYSAIKLSRLLSEKESSIRSLRESEEKHRALVDGLPDIIMRLDRHGRHLFVSDNVKNASGIPASAFIGKTHREMGFADHMCHFWEQAIQEVFDSGLPLETEFQFAGPEGNIIYDWRLSPEYDAQGNIQSVLTISRDITDPRRMEQTLRENEAKFRGYIENAPHGVFVVDRNGRCIEANPAATRITGYTETELLCMHIPDILTPESLDAGIAHFQEVLQTGLALGGEMAYRHAGGDIRHFRISAARVSENQFIGFAEDITAIKMTEAERENLQAQLVQSRKMDAVGRLAGGMAHDFNNMLGTIFANAEAAKEDLEPTDPVFECIVDIHSAAKRSADMIRQLLAFARQQTISPKLMDLNHNIGSMLKMLRRLIGEHIQLDWQPGLGLRPVNMDPSQVDQILANLCINARDAISGNGRIIIETENIAVDEKHCQDRPYLTRGDFVIMSVGDNGAGMDAATREHIFEPFFSTKHIGKGTGLGLATVYGIVKQNAGFIHVESQPGKGSRFTIYLPASDENIADTAVENSGGPRQAIRGSETILLVEDEGMFLDVIRTQLRKSGFTILAAATPTTAMRAAADHDGPIHLLITDVMMPETCGPELADNLKKLYPDMKCLFMSGYAEDIIAHQGKMPRDVEFIAKPFSITDLISKILAVLGGEE